MFLLSTKLLFSIEVNLPISYKHGRIKTICTFVHNTIGIIYIISSKRGRQWPQTATSHDPVPLSLHQLPINTSYMPIRGAFDLPLHKYLLDLVFQHPTHHSHSSYIILVTFQTTYNRKSNVLIRLYVFSLHNNNVKRLVILCMIWHTSEVVPYT